MKTASKIVFEQHTIFCRSGVCRRFDGQLKRSRTVAYTGFFNEESLKTRIAQGCEFKALKNPGKQALKEKNRKCLKIRVKYAKIFLNRNFFFFVDEQKKFTRS